MGAGGVDLTAIVGPSPQVTVVRRATPKYSQKNKLMENVDTMQLIRHSRRVLRPILAFSNWLS